MKKILTFTIVCLLVLKASTQTNEILIPYKNGPLWGFADTAGTVKINPEFTELPKFNTNIAIVQIGDQYGAIDRVGKKLVNVEFTKCFHFLDEYFLVYSTKVCGVVNSNKDTVVPFLYTRIEMYPILSGREMYQKKPETIETDYFYAYKFIEGNSTRTKGILKKEKDVWTEHIPCTYKEIYYNRNDKSFTAERYSADSVDYIDLNGSISRSISVKKHEETIEELEIMAMDFAIDDIENTAAPERKYPYLETTLSKKGKGLIITNQSYAQRKKIFIYDTIPAIYDSIITQYSHYRLYPVQTKGKWGLLGSSGSMLLYPEFEDIRIEIDYFKRTKLERVLIKKNGKWGIIQLDGPPTKKKNNYTVLLSINYDDLQIFRTYTDVILVNQNGLWGVESISKPSLHIAPKYRQILDSFHIVDRYPLFQIVTKDKSTVYVGINGVEFFTNIEL